MEQKEYAFNLTSLVVGERITFNIKVRPTNLWLWILNENTDQEIEMELTENQYENLCKTLIQIKELIENQ